MAQNTFMPGLAFAESQISLDEDFGLLLVRAIISTYLIIVSVSTFFQIGANPGLTGLQHDFATYTFGSALSIIIPTLQLTAGIFLLYGLLSPMATTLVIPSFDAKEEYKNL